MGTRVDRAHPLLALAWPGPGILSAWGQINIGSNWGNIKLDKASLEQIIRDETHLKYIFLWFARFFSVFSKSYNRIVWTCKFAKHTEVHFMERIKNAQAMICANFNFNWPAASWQKLLPQNEAMGSVYDLVSLADEVWWPFTSKVYLNNCVALCWLILLRWPFRFSDALASLAMPVWRALKTLSELHSAFV